GPTLQAVARELPGATVAPTTTLVDAFIDAGITASKGAARRDADGGGLSVNGEKISSEALQTEVADLDPLPGGHLPLSRGRKNAAMVRIAGCRSAHRTGRSTSPGRRPLDVPRGSSVRVGGIGAARGCAGRRAQRRHCGQRTALVRERNRNCQADEKGR